jgi:hypothetical protein
MGSEENQFTPPGAGVNKLIFKLLKIFRLNIMSDILFSIEI